MSNNGEHYNGWTNYETWCVALWINNDQGWQESVHEALRAESSGWRDDDEPSDEPTISARRAGEIVRENVERVVSWDFELWDDVMPASLSADLVGRALERVEWDEIGAAFLQDVREQEQQ